MGRKLLDVRGPDEEDATFESDRSLMMKELGKSEENDQNTILRVFRHVLALWARELNDRSLDVKVTFAGRMESARHKQTVEYIEPLFNALQRHVRHYSLALLQIVLVCQLLADAGRGDDRPVRGTDARGARARLHQGAQPLRGARHRQRALAYRTYAYILHSTCSWATVAGGCNADTMRGALLRLEFCASPLWDSVMRAGRDEPLHPLAHGTGAHPRQEPGARAQRRGQAQVHTGHQTAHDAGADLLPYRPAPLSQLSRYTTINLQRLFLVVNDS